MEFSSWVSAIGTIASAAAAWFIWKLTVEYVRWTKRQFEISRELLEFQKRPSVSIVPIARGPINRPDRVAEIVNLSTGYVYILDARVGNISLMLESADGESITWNRMLFPGEQCLLKNISGATPGDLSYANNVDVHIKFHFGPTGEMIHKISIPIGTGGSEKLPQP